MSGTTARPLTGQSTILIVSIKGLCFDSGILKYKNKWIIANFWGKVQILHRFYLFLFKSLIKFLKKVLLNSLSHSEMYENCVRSGGKKVRS